MAWLSGVFLLTVSGPRLSPKSSIQLQLSVKNPSTLCSWLQKGHETEEPIVTAKFDFSFIHNGHSQHVFLCAQMPNWSWEIENIDLTQCLTLLWRRGGGVSAPSWLLAPCSHIGLATQPVPRETHNYSRPFRLVQQSVQLWLHSLVIYFICFPLLRGTPQHNDQASLYNNVCDDKHSGS